jgi:FixJ family two-component response regulator
MNDPRIESEIHGTPGPTPRRVFIVDDDPGVRRAIARLVRSAGHEVTTFGSAEELLAEAELSDPRTSLILDIRLPGISGIELHRRLVASRRHIPTIFISGHVEPREAKRVVPDEAVAFLPKPFVDSDLLGALESSHQETPS